MVSGPLRVRVADMVGDLEHQHGACFATERAKRAHLARKGKCPGEKSVGRVERQMAREGKIRRIRVLPGGRLVGGRFSEVPPALRAGLKYAAHGYVIQWSLSRQVQRTEARRRRKEAQAAKRRESEASNQAAIRAAAAAVREREAKAPRPRKPAPPAMTAEERAAFDEARRQAMATLGERGIVRGPGKGPDPPR